MGISAKWSKLALSAFGDKAGRHCHWCKFINFDSDTAECSHKDSPFCAGGRIWTWDGLGCALECQVFELDDWYTNDENYNKYFRGLDK